MTEPVYLTFSAFAKEAGVSIGTIRAAVLRGQLKAKSYKVAGALVWRIHRAELATYSPDPARVRAAKRGKA